jgi:hypothetical protein
MHADRPDAPVPERRDPAFERQAFGVRDIWGRFHTRLWHLGVAPWNPTWNLCGTYVEPWNRGTVKPRASRAPDNPSARALSSRAIAAMKAFVLEAIFEEGVLQNAVHAENMGNQTRLRFRRI